jgi:hypothetical protein
MMKIGTFSKLGLFIIGFTPLLCFGGDVSIGITCSTATYGATSCESTSQNVLTKMNVVAGTGNVTKIKLRNIESVPVDITNNANTDQMYLFADVNNRGRAQDLNVDLRPSFIKKTAPSWMSRSPNAGSSLVVADSIKTLSVNVSGYFGNNGRSLSELCGARAKASGGYYTNPDNDPDIVAANKTIAAGVTSKTAVVNGVEVSIPVCSAATLNLISSNQPGNFCPNKQYIYLSGRDNLAQPELSKSQGEVRGILSSFTDEAPVRLQFMKKCVMSVTYRSCRFSNATVTKVEDNLTKSCDDRYSELVGSGDLPQGMTVIETSTAMRDKASYYEEGASTDPASVGKCPDAGEVLESYTQLHGLDAYEQIDCKFADCPGATDTYTYDSYSPASVQIEPGEDGSFGGRFDIFAYDIENTSTLNFSNGANGTNGRADLTIPQTKKFCAKVDDARNVNGSIESAKMPLVNFHTALYSPIVFTLPAAVPGTAFKNRTLPEAVGIYKKIDSSVRDYILREYVDVRFP